ncbi:DM9 repeat-containing protein [Legionella sp. km772]|uniref:DM9 repeat-containing protein n=1 Tax=Legionella sp. km772 TaxID=2498111 RepID=UPI000F8EE867|nr:DM9 repeat-containing protein [Legionella sp. km772]RUR12442.1 DUF3421 domain-containing protein [Legionella sp. km772]
MKRSLIFLLLSFFGISSAALSSNPASSLLVNALIIGRDLNKQPFFLCRVQLNGVQEVGILASQSSTCILTKGDKLYPSADFSIPDKREFGLFTWSRNTAGAITVGSTQDGKPLFLCQSNFNGLLLPGKTWPGFGHCEVVYNGKLLIAELTYILVSLK